MISTVPVRDTYQQLKTAQKKKDEVVQYKLGDAVTHPKFGHGIVEKINQRSGGVHLHIRFDGSVGSGKTFFVKEILIPSIVKHEKEKKDQDSKYKEKRILYVSLYME